MSSTISDVAAAVVMPAQNRSGRDLVNSLWVRLVAAVAAFLGLMLAAMFFSIDHFVSGGFERIHEERTERQARQAQQAVAQQRAQLASLASLLGNDRDLFNSTYYHLYLEGERDHPQAAVERIAEAFHIDYVAILDAADGRVVAMRSTMPGQVTRLPTDGAAWIDGEVWTFASATLVHNANPMATLVVGRPLGDIFTGLFGFDQSVTVTPAAGDGPVSGAVRISVDDQAAPPVAIDVRVQDTVAAALRKVKRVVAALLTGAGVLLLVIIALSLALQLRPLRQLAEAAAAIGRGEFAQRLDPRGGTEVRTLVQAFNAMAGDLGRMRALEQELRHREQLAALGRVAARVAHDINNPLTVIRNLAEIHRDRVDAAPQDRQDMQQVVHHCDRCMQVVENLLAYARPIRLRTRDIDLNRFCEEMLERSSLRLMPGVRWRFSPAAGVVMVEADPYQLEQMLENVLTNAGQAGGDAGPVEIEVGRREGLACLCVRDSGPGFSPEAREHLFEPFFTTKSKGSGLGLASAMAIARAHGGDIRIEGEGCGQVAILLPMTRATIQA